MTSLSQALALVLVKFWPECVEKHHTPAAIASAMRGAVDVDILKRAFHSHALRKATKDLFGTSYMDWQRDRMGECAIKGEFDNGYKIHHATPHVEHGKLRARDKHGHWREVHACLTAVHVDETVASRSIRLLVKVARAAAARGVPAPPNYISLFGLATGQGGRGGPAGAGLQGGGGGSEEEDESD
eukprot:CAMPEP_0173271162 /NCGR_PEP_ID=MMETSP1143-20121109/652_1 /TAXON_ID=483371 /ORGANISM="non described non described, Strain CCMP2298" /LENGTH=184 /DNA_ID=CAMNT_0014207673 /DNA_START=121 /DNA_END=676 /DNA_ORIENTATION=-